VYLRSDKTLVPFTLALLLASATAVAQTSKPSDTRQLELEVSPAATDSPPETAKPESEHETADAVVTQNQRVALVIGNGAYVRSSLPNPPNDAHLVAATLKALGFEVLELLNGSQKEMKRAINEFGAKLKRGAVGVFYYAGHGLQVFGRNYLVPVDAEIHSYEDVDVETIDLNRVMAQLEMAKNPMNIVIVDACRDNPFNSLSDNFKLGLAPPRAPKGTVVAYATSPGKVAEDGDGDNSPFAAALAAQLRTPGVESLQMLKRVGTSVNKKTAGRQTPWFTSSAAADFYFVKGDQAPKLGAIAPPERDLLAPRDQDAPVLGYVIAGTGVALTAAGTYFGLKALSTNREIQDLCDSDLNNCQTSATQKAEDRDRQANLANLGVGLGLVGVIVGTVMVLNHDSGTEPRWQTANRRPLRLDATVGHQTSSVWLRGTF